ncbi:MAG TPA: enhanced serine sensitivity protein SseB C-terminal domain-containing protein [Solirubrobacteraceae bacterium]|nr:enhanced serine sensitivity protein SseB C-terminal domain-containing protein [Solirubrobacteraceae bacterium]
MGAEAFTPTNPLEQAMQRAALDPAANADFLAALAENEVLVPLNSLPEGDRVELPHFAVDGVDHIAVFTSEAQLDRAEHPRVGALRLTGSVLALMWPPGIPMALNPRGELGVSIPSQDVQALNAPPGSAGFRHLPAGSELIVGAPAQEPGELLRRLSDKAATLDDVAALHRALIKVKNTPEPPWTAIGVELKPGIEDAQVVVAQLAEAGGGDGSLIVLREDATDPISSYMLKVNEPFYRSA